MGVLVIALLPVVLIGAAILFSFLWNEKQEEEWEEFERMMNEWHDNYMKSRR